MFVYNSSAISLFPHSVAVISSSVLLFRYVLEGHSRTKSQELRELIAKSVAADPVKYNEVFLGKSNEEYQNWIRKPDSWGG